MVYSRKNPMKQKSARTFGMVVQTAKALTLSTVDDYMGAFTAVTHMIDTGG